MDLLFGKRRERKFYRLIYPHAGQLYGVALNYCGSRHDAEEMVQETMSIAYEKLHQLRDEKKSKSWVFAILRNIFFKELRQKERFHNFYERSSADYLEELDAFQGDGDVISTLTKSALEGELKEVLYKLPEKYRLPLILYYMEEMSYRELSEILEVPAGTVMSRLSRAKLFFKKEMVKKARREAGRSSEVLPFVPRKKGGDQ